MTRPGRSARPAPPGDLVEHLPGPFRRPQVAPGEAQIRVDHPDQSEPGKMVPLGEYLRADQQVHRPVPDIAHQRCRGRRPADRVAGRHQDPGARQQPGDLFGEPLDARSARYETVFRAAFRARAGQRPRMAAMVAFQPAGEPVFDQPGGALRALQAQAAGAAQGERRISAAVEIKQGLFPRRQRFGHRGDDAVGKPAAARRPFLPQVEQFDLWHRGAGVAFRQDQPRIAPAFDIGDGFQRRRRGGEQHGNPLERRPDDRHVPGVIDHAVFLLEALVVLLVDDDQAQFGHRQHERGARADHDPGPRRSPRRARSAAAGRGSGPNARAPARRRSAARSGRAIGRSGRFRAAGRSPAGPGAAPRRWLRNRLPSCPIR